MTLKIGDLVYLKRVYTTPNRMRMTIVSARVVDIQPSKSGGTVIQVKLRNGRKELVHESEVEESTAKA
jgi:hypothetical protein